MQENREPRVYAVCSICNQPRDPITIATTLEPNRCFGCGMPYKAPDPEHPFRASIPEPPRAAPKKKLGARRMRRQRNQQAALLSPPKP